MYELIAEVHQSSQGSTTLPKHSHEESNDPHTVVGLTLLIGFVMMLIIDQFSTGLSSNAHYNSLPTTG